LIFVLILTLGAPLHLIANQLGQVSKVKGCLHTLYCREYRLPTVYQPWVILDYSSPGLPDFSWYNKPKREKIYLVTMKYTKWPQNIPNGTKIDQMVMVIKYTKLQLQDPPKFTKFTNLQKLGLLV
jgi:hypothetical protein